MLREQREEILNDLITESFINTKSEPISEQDAKKLKDYLNYVKNFINKKMIKIKLSYLLMVQINNLKKE